MTISEAVKSFDTKRPTRLPFRTSFFSCLIATPSISSGVILPGMTSRAEMPSSVISRMRVLGVQRLVTVRRSTPGR